MNIRVGQGFDAHKFIDGRPLFLGGVNVPFEKGLAGHSDADVLLHAIIDAMLGASGLGNIGRFFPDTDPKYKDVSSLLLLEQTKKLLDENGFSIVNMDSVVILEQPRLEPHWESMKQVMSKILQIDPELISLKAKTTETMGFTGRGEGIAAMTTILLSLESEVGSRE